MQLKPTQAETAALLFQAEHTSRDYKVLAGKITLVPPQYIVHSIKNRAHIWLTCQRFLCFALFQKLFFFFPLAALGGGIAYVGDGSNSSVQCSVLMH